jgi:hypothetical protein
MFNQELIVKISLSENQAILQNPISFQARIKQDCHFVLHLKQESIKTIVANEGSIKIKMRVFGCVSIVEEEGRMSGSMKVDILEIDSQKSMMVDVDSHGTSLADDGVRSDLVLMVDK